MTASTCTDVAFPADNKTAPTTKCECATCLKTSMDDPRCSSFDKCPADIVIRSSKCIVSGPCDCLSFTGNTDTLVVTGFAHGPVDAVASVPNVTGDAVIDCGGWALTPGAVYGAESGCKRNPDAASYMEWSSTGSAQTICQCNQAGVPLNFTLSLISGDPNFPTTLATDMSTVTCP